MEDKERTMCKVNRIWQECMERPPGSKFLIGARLVLTLVVAIGLTLGHTAIAAPGGGQGKVVTKVAVNAQVGTPVYGTSGQATFTVTISTNSGLSAPVTVTPSISGLPSGATGSFNPLSVDAAKGTHSYDVVLTIDTSTSIPAGATTFTVAADGVDGIGTLTIGQRVLTVSATAQDKFYDGTTTAIVTMSDDHVLGDQLTIASASPAFGSANAGPQTVTVTGIAISGGSAAGNYTLASQTATTTATIAPRALSVTGITAADKEYDGTTAASLNTGSAMLVGVLSGDVLNVTLNTGSATGAFADATAGTGKTVMINGLSLTGAAAANYSVSQPTTTASITDTVPVFSQTSPISDSYINKATVGYNLSKNVINGTGTITFTRTGGTVDASSPHVYHLTQPDLGVGSHTIDTGFSLANGAIYMISFDAVDGSGYAAITVSNTNVLYDTIAAVVTLDSPASSGYVNNTTVGYTLSKEAKSGTIVYTRTDGTADAASPHSYILSGADLAAGQHTVPTGLTLVNGTVYTVTIENVVDPEGNTSTVVANTGITYDTTTVTITSTGPAANSFIVNANVVYILSEVASAGTITFTRTGGAADPGSPHVYTMAPQDLNAGDHTGNNTVVTGLPLVVGAVYTVTFDISDQAGNHSVVSCASLTMELMSATLTADKTSPAQLATVGTVTFTAQASGGSGNYDYQFYMKDSTTGITSVVQPYSPLNTMTWTPDHAGAYNVTVYARNAGSPMLQEVAKGLVFYVLAHPPVTSVTLEADKTSPQVLSSMGAVTFTAAASGGYLQEYKFVVRGPSTMTQDYSESTTLSWTPSQPGIYAITVFARSDGSPLPVEAVKSLSIIIMANAPVTSVTLGTDKTSPQVLSSVGTVTFNATAGGGDGTPLYKFTVTGPSSMTQDFSTSNMLLWTPTQPGNYVISVYAKNEGSPLGYETSKSLALSVLANSPVTSVTLGADKTSPQLLPTMGAVTFTAAASGGYSPEYKFVVRGPSTMTQDYSASTTTLFWTPSQAGIYTITVFARSEGSPLTFEAAKSLTFTVMANTPVTSVTLGAGKASPQVLTSVGTVTFSATASGGSGTPLYKFTVTGPSTMTQDFSVSNTLSWTPTQTGNYVITVYAKNERSPLGYETSKSLAFNVLTNAPITSVTLGADKASPQLLSTVGAVMFNAAASGGDGTPQYKFVVTGPSTITQDYGASNTLSWTPTQLGTYSVVVYARNFGSTMTYEAVRGMSFILK
jgi:uncharacterized protein (DUF779 family)